MKITHAEIGSTEKHVLQAGVMTVPNNPSYDVKCKTSLPYTAEHILQQTK